MNAGHMLPCLGLIMRSSVSSVWNSVGLSRQSWDTYIIRKAFFCSQTFIPCSLVDWENADCSQSQSERWKRTNKGRERLAGGDGGGGRRGEQQSRILRSRSEAGAKQEKRNEVLWSWLLLWIRRCHRPGHVCGGPMLTSALCWVTAPPSRRFDITGCQMSRVCLRQTSEPPRILPSDTHRCVVKTVSLNPLPTLLGARHRHGVRRSINTCDYCQHCARCELLLLCRYGYCYCAFFLYFPPQRLARGWNATRERCAGWRWGGRSAFAHQTAPTSPASTLCAAATGRRTRTSAPCCWPAAWATRTWRSCTRASAKVSLPC